MNELVIKNQEDLIEFANDYVKKNHIIPSPNYNLNNAMIGLFNNVLSVKDKNGKMATETCSPMSIQNAIYTCIQKELTPTKNQTYFIPWGNELKQHDSYFGLIKMVRDYCGANVFGDVILEGDSVKIENRIDGTKVIYHQSNVDSIFSNKPIIGAYAVASDIKTGRVIDSDIMTTRDINMSASRSKTGGTVHKDFKNRMSRKTVIRRLCISLLNASDDTKFNSFDNFVDEDNFIDYSYTINTEEQIESEKTKFNPTEEDVVSIDNLKLDEIQPIETSSEMVEGAFEISYSKYKNNKDIYTLVPNSYNARTKTCFVTQNEE